MAWLTLSKPPPIPSGGFFLSQAVYLPAAVRPDIGSINLIRTL